MNKQELRIHYRALRQTLPAARRQEAALLLLQTIQSLPFDRLASFCSTSDEIDTHSLNALFASSGRLLLPKCLKDGLEYCLVTDLASLRPSSYGPPEPNPHHTPTALTGRDLILVPALAFDKAHYRLGYGKGHFDRFLTDNPTIPTAGVGFREQLSADLLPRDPWDRPVQMLYLF